MKRLILIAGVLFLAGCGGGSSTPTPVADFAGNWTGNWSSDAWNGSAVQKNGTAAMTVSSTGAVTKGSITLAGQNTPTRTFTGQLAAGGSGTFTVTDTATNTQYTGTGQFDVDGNHLNMAGVVQTTNTSGALVDSINLGLSQ